MKIFNPFALLLLTLVCLLNEAKGQSVNKIECLALVKADSVILRWVPSTIPVLQTGVKYGYVINRYTIAKDGVFIPDGLGRAELLTTIPVKPAATEKFDEIAERDPRGTVVQEAIYSSEFQFPTENQNFSGFMKSYEDLEVRFGFAMFICDLSPAIASAAGLRYTDHNIKPGERYVYSISISNIPDGLQMDPAVIVVDADQKSSLPIVTDLQAVFLDKKVTLQWPIVLFKGIYTAYIIEKSNNGSDFHSVSDLPLLNFEENEEPGLFVFTDSLINNNEVTYYRVRGISAFGETGPPSEIMKGKGSSEFNAYAVIDSSAVIANNNVFLHWRITETESVPVTGINVMWSEKNNGVYQSLTRESLPPQTRTFTDIRPGLNNYYKIMLTEQHGITSSSFPFLVQTEDHEAPVPPSMLAGRVDSCGIVIITWKSNSEPDIMGYKIFRANAEHENFIAVNHNLLTNNVFNDTINLNTLTKKIFYKVVAVDANFNNSEYSTPLELSRPDTIPPACALIKRIETMNGKVILGLEPSPSNDIAFYELTRISESKMDSVVLNSWQDNPDPVVIDTPPSSGEYLYILKTFDTSGNVSFYNRSVYVSGGNQKEMPFKAVHSNNGKLINLNWVLPEGFIPAKTLIYRSIKGSPISIYQTIAGTYQMYEDDAIEIGAQYTYRVRIFDSQSNAILNSGLIEAIPFSTSK